MQELKKKEEISMIEERVGVPKRRTNQEIIPDWVRSIIHIYAV